MSRNLLLHTSRNLLLYTIKSFKMQGDLQLYNPGAFLSGGRELQSHFYLRPRAPGGLGAGCPPGRSNASRAVCQPSAHAGLDIFCCRARCTSKQYTELRVKLFLCGHGKGRRDWYQLNILCGNDRWLRRPGPWPDAEAVTSDPFHRKS